MPHEALLKLPESDYEITQWSDHKVHPDCFTRVQKSLYSVPFDQVGNTVMVKIRRRTLEIYDKNYNLIGVHEHAKHVGQRVKDVAHFPQYVEQLSHGSHRYLLSRAEKYGEEISGFCVRVLELHGVGGYRMAQGILAVAQRHPREKLLEALIRLIFYSNYTYKALKNLLEEKHLTSLQVKDFENNQVAIKSTEQEEYLQVLKQYDLKIIY